MKARSSEHIKELLGRATGLDLGTLAPGLMVRAVHGRMRDLGIRDEAAYLDLLASDSREVDELVEVVVVPETWFFRDMGPFELLRQHAAAWPGRGRGKIFSCLSAPCSTGEEPYSMAMALLSAGLDPARISVQGLDISRKALETARQGVYGPNSFRGTTPDYAACFFKDTSKGRKVADQVRSCVSFDWANLTLGRQGLEKDSFEAVFCRNFLIYLDQEGKRRLAQALHGLLRPGGLLFVGHAEMLPVFSDLFSPVRHPKAFAYVKDDQAMRAAKKIALPARPPKPAAPPALKPRPEPAMSRPAKPRPAPARREERPKPESRAPEPGLLDTARDLADKGRLAQAEEACLKALDQCGPSAGAYHLLGLVRDAKGDTDGAVECLAKALYLRPDHEQSLVHLALLAEKLGDDKRAEGLRRRLARLAQRNRVDA